MPLNSSRPAPRVASDNPFGVRCEAVTNRFAVQTDSITVTVSQRVLRDGVLELWESVGVYAKENEEGELVVEVLVFNPDWDEPLRIACIRSRPKDTSCLTPLACVLDHATP